VFPLHFPRTHRRGAGCAYRRVGSQARQQFLQAVGFGSAWADRFGQASQQKKTGGSPARFASDAYFAILDKQPELNDAFQIGKIRPGRYAHGKALLIVSAARSI